MNDDQKLFLRDQLRSAREDALADAEGFSSAVHCIEGLGKQLLLKARGIKYAANAPGLTAYMESLTKFASCSPLAKLIPGKWPQWHTNFEDLLGGFINARNDAVHQGAHARTLADHAVELTLILEDSLMTDEKLVSQFMVRNVVVAQDWYPISYIRLQMLKSAFTFLPYFDGHVWRLVSDYQLAGYLRGEASKQVRKTRLIETLGDAVANGWIETEVAVVVAHDLTVAKFLRDAKSKPALIVDEKNESVLLGMVTASDVL